ncbi:MAG: hypothetical protein HKN97_12915 [Myxococcales bacterium]|nr:hypothetical protein [Myxococcales bacterium]
MKPRTSSADCPRLELHNGGLRVSMYLPDAQRGYYRGTRFDWSGLIEQVECHGHRFYGPLHIEHDPYRFDDEYRMVHPGEWVVEHGPAWVAFTQALHGERGWAYHYRKAIRLHECHSAFVIEHRLENRGDKTIDITNYNHNFTIIDDVPYGRDYVVEFPFSTDAPIPLGDIAWFRGSQIDVDRPLEDLALWWPVFEGDDPGNYNAAAVRNRRTGAAVAFRGDAPITRMVFWAVERAACPEPFIRIYLEPGRTQTWSTTYRFTVDAAPDHPQ